MPQPRSSGTAGPADARSPERRIGHGVILAVVLGLAIAVYCQVALHPFTDLDDGQYVVGNPHVRAGLTWQGLRWAFASTDVGNWHPLTWISHQADVELFGLSPGAHHLVNLLLHLVNTVLLFSVLAAMTGSPLRSGFVAAVFALHPLHVESVAWISERKDLLSALFAFLTLIAYLRHAKKPSLRAYLPVPVLFAFGLMSKPMLVTLPFVLLLLDYWPLGRLAGESGPPAARELPGIPAVPLKRLLVEKAPLVVLSAASAAVTFIAQEGGGAVADTDIIRFSTRAANAVVAYASYVVKTAWPSPLAVYYPYPLEGIATWKVVAGAACIVLVTGTVLRFRRSRPALPVGWFWFLGTLVPVIGLVQVGLQAMADRYTYLPQTGLAIMIAYGIFRERPRGAFRALPVPAALLLLLAMSVASWFQVRLWSSNESLFTHAVRHTEGNFIAYDALGKAALSGGRPDEAIRYIREAVRIRPTYSLAQYNLGVACSAAGRIDDAIAAYRETLRLRPDTQIAWTNLGVLLYGRGQVDDAARCYLEAVRLNPDDPLAHNNIGLVLARRGQKAEAVRHFREALRLDPGYATAARNLRNTLGN